MSESRTTNAMPLLRRYTPSSQINYNNKVRIYIRWNVQTLTILARKHIKDMYSENITYRNVMALNALRSTFKNSTVGKAVMAGALALPLTFGGMAAANDARAGEPQVVSKTNEPEVEQKQVLQAVQGMRSMRKYSEDPATQGVGVFINLQANAPMTGEQIGDHLRDAFARLDPPVPLEYRVNQSRGTATDITFYVRGYDFTMTVTDIANEGLGNILANYRDVWQPEQVSLNNQPQ